MAAEGVRTLYLQGARASEGTRFPTADPWLLAEYLLAAHAADVAVVAWYLPMWEDGDEDLDRLVALSAFEVLGHRFDGLAVDIEWKDDGLEHDERSRRLVELGERLRATVGTDVLGGIVMPPVVTEEINPDFWPGFPWAEIRTTYDVWLPMSYWCTDLPDPGEPLAAVGDLDGFLTALDETGAVGGSIYDWVTTGVEARRHLAEAFSDR